MDRNEEIRSLREEITRLKLRLSELDKTTEPTSAVCGHDIVLEHLRKLTKQHGLNGLCQLAGTDNKHGWYTTNIEPSKIKLFLNGSDTLREFITIFSLNGVWEALEAAYYNELDDVNNDHLLLLQQKDLIKDCRLTSRGFMCYAVLGHLAFNMTKKLEPNKTISIYKLAYDVTGINYGEPLPYTSTEFLDLIKKHPAYNDLVQEGVTETDILEYIRQNNV